MRTRSPLAYRPEIDGLRALAVACVIAFHAVPRALPGGFVGVDVFFVISGYLITRGIQVDLDGARFSLRDFYARRARRILPGLLLLFALCYAFAWFALLPSELRWLGRSYLWCAPFLANLFFAHVTGYFDPGSDYNLLLHLWSLGVEEQFYLLWPLLLLAAASRGLTRTVLLSLIPVSLAIAVWGAWHAPAAHFFLPAPRLWELGTGALLATGPFSPPRIDAHTGCAQTRLHALWAGWRGASALAGLLLIAGAALALSPQRAYPGPWAVPPVLGAALLLDGVAQSRIIRSLLASAPLVFVGRISYPLYLWHWPVLACMRSLWGPAPGAAALLGALALAAAAATLSEYLLERPVRAAARSRTVAFLLSGLMAFTILGAATSAGRIGGRLNSPALAAWDSAVQDWSLPPLSRAGGDFAAAQVFALRGGGRRLTLFIGDSHLQQYWPRAAAVLAAHPGTANSALFLTAAGCPSLPGLESSRPLPDCASFFAAASRRALQPDIDTVVFGSFWEAYLLGEFDTGARQAVHRAGDPLHRRLEWDSMATEQAFAGLEALCARLSASGHRVFIVLSNPTSPQFEPRWLLPARIRLGIDPVTSIASAPEVAVDPAGFEAYVAVVRARLLRLAARSGAQVLDPRSTLCAGLKCTAKPAGGTPHYLDSNHLSSRFAREQAGFLDVTLFR